MRNIFTLVKVIIILTLFSEGFVETPQNIISYRLFITHPTTHQKHLLTEGKIKEGEFFIFPKIKLENTKFSNFQKFYDAVTGSKFGFDDNALEHNIEIEINLTNLDQTTGAFNKIGKAEDEVLIYFEISVLDQTTNLFYEGDNSYYFKSPNSAYFLIPKSADFKSYCKQTGFNTSGEDLLFGYLINDYWNTDEIKTIDTEEYFGFRASHFSRFGGGRGNSIGNVTSADDKSENEIPTKFYLSQNYPNPFNPQTKIEFGIEEKSEVQLKVYNILGIEVVTLVDDQLNAGVYEVSFDGTKMTSGIYLYELQNGSETIIKKMTLIK